VNEASRLVELAWLGGTLLAAGLVGYIAHRVLWWFLARLVRRTETGIDDSLVRRCRRPTALIAPVLMANIVLPALQARVGEGALAVAGNVLQVLLPISIGWTLIALAGVAEDFVRDRFDVTHADNLRARAIHTQVRIIKRIAITAIVVLTLAVILMSFEELRQVGTGLLASAGVAGLVIGLAAQRALANLLAGIQIALTQPIRFDDVLVVEGEWGRVEEITLTYVVVRIWDLRRLVLPISYFLEKPFQNWTRTSADVLGTVYLHVDYAVPVEEIRSELKKIVERREEWDGKVCGVQVTGTNPRGVEVRALVSATDASKAWDLRCAVRESLVSFINERFPESLPRLRTELHRFDENGRPAPLQGPAGSP
jgi:small-conductance mechanosensitive channel